MTEQHFTGETADGTRFVVYGDPDMSQATLDALEQMATKATEQFDELKARHDMRFPIVPMTAALAVAGLPGPTDADWGAISEIKQAEADRYYGRGHSDGRKPLGHGVDKRRAKRKASRKARKAGR